MSHEHATPTPVLNDPDHMQDLVLNLPAPTAPHGFDAIDDGSSWDYTKNATEIAELRRQLERQSGHEGRPTIGRDSHISEGVYEGRYGGEAIVVDYEKDPELIDATVEQVLTRSMDPRTGKPNKGRILDSVFSTVSEKMSYNSEAVDSIFKTALNGRDGRKISLSYYIQQGVGECRHQALFAGVVLEKLKERGVVNGTASVDRNMVRRGPDGKYDGHAWVRYTNSEGQVYILDVAQHKLDTLEGTMAAHEQDPSHNWDYARPEDKQKVAGQIALQATGIESPYDPSTYMNKAGVIDRLPWQK